MFCPKCGTNMEDGNSICPNCSFEFTNEISKEPQASKGKSIFNAVKDFVKNLGLARTIYLIIALIIIIMSFSAASKVYEGGLEIMQIQSVGGRTLEEAYYYELGTVYAGYSIFIRTVGIFFASVLCKFAADQK